MCEEKDRAKNSESTTEQSAAAGPSAASREARPPDCCGPMIEKMMRAFAESSAKPEKDSSAGESQPGTSASCASMMQQMKDICGCFQTEDESGSDQSKHSCAC